MQQKTVHTNKWLQKSQNNKPTVKPKDTDNQQVLNMH